MLKSNESAHTTAVNNANSAHSTATANAEAARKSAEQAALTQLNSTLAQATKDKEALIARAERTYDQTVASLDAQYGSESSNGDTGVEGATRRSAIKTRDAQYYAARDTSWANTLSGSTTLGTSPWTVKAISAANGQAAHSVSRANAQAAHDAAMLDAIEDWQLSSRESLTDLLSSEGQSRETYNVATSNVYANWENGVGNLLGDKPEGTGYVPVRGFGEGGVGTMGGAGAMNTTRIEEGDDDPKDSGLKSDETATPRPILPPSEGTIVWLTPQQMLELERQHGLEMMDRFRRAYRVRDPNVGWLPGDSINSLSTDLISEMALNQTSHDFALNIPYSASNKEPLIKLTLEEWSASAAPDLPIDYDKVKSVGCLGVVQAYAGKLNLFGAPTRMFHVKDRPDLSLGMAILAARELKAKGYKDILIFANHYYDGGPNPPESLGCCMFEVEPRIHSGTKTAESPGFDFAAYDFEHDCWWGATFGGEGMMVVRWPDLETFAKSYPDSYNTTVVGVTVVGPGTAFHPEKYENFWQDYWHEFQQNLGF